MKIGAIPETLPERLLLTAGALPTPVVDTFNGLLLVRIVMAATKLGVFEALATGPLTAHQTAEKIGKAIIEAAQ